MLALMVVMVLTRKNLVNLIAAKVVKSEEFDVMKRRACTSSIDLHNVFKRFSKLFR